VQVDVTIAGRHQAETPLLLMILGYPTIRLAGWLFDFPARRWTITN
jgi:hypothetical protein